MLFSEVFTVGHDDELVIRVIGSLNHCDTSARKVRNRHVHAQYIGVQFVAIESRHTRNIPVVYRVDETMFRVPGTLRTVYTDSNGFSDEYPGVDT